MIDNREAMAYMLFRRFGCSRIEALAAVDELAAYWRPIAKVAARSWRSRRRVTTEASPPGAGRRG